MNDNRFKEREILPNITLRIVTFPNISPYPSWIHVHIVTNNLNSGRQSENAGEIKQRRKKRLYRSQLFLRKNEAFSDQRISKHPSHIITTSHQSQPCMPTSQPFTVNVGRKFRNSQKPQMKSSLKDNGPVPTIKTTS